MTKTFLNKFIQLTLCSFLVGVLLFSGSINIQALGGFSKGNIVRVTASQLNVRAADCQTVVHVLPSGFSLVVVGNILEGSTELPSEITCEIEGQKYRMLQVDIGDGKYGNYVAIAFTEFVSMQQDMDNVALDGQKVNLLYRVTTEVNLRDQNCQPIKLLPENSLISRAISEEKFINCNINGQNYALAQVLNNNVETGYIAIDYMEKII